VNRNKNEIGDGEKRRSEIVRKGRRRVKSKKQKGMISKTMIQTKRGKA